MRDSLDTGLYLLCKTDSELEQIYRESRKRSNDYFEADGRLTNIFTCALFTGLVLIFVGWISSIGFFALFGLFLVFYGAITLVLSLYYQYLDIKYAKIGDLAYDIRYRNR